MKQKMALILVIILMCNIIQPIAKGVNSHTGGGEVIVKYKGGILPAYNTPQIQLEKEWVFQDRGSIPYTLAYFTSDEMSTKELVHYFFKVPNVEYAEPNYKLQTMAYEAPNDPYLGTQWYISNEVLDYERSSLVDVGIESLWAETDNNVERNVVAIIDTGVDYTHPDLAQHMWENQITLPGKYGYNFIDQNDDPMDLLGHGTHCAGLIAAVANNEIGIAGISRNTKIMALKCMDETGSGSVSHIIDAYAYILQAKKQGVNIVAISNSWGERVNPKALEDMIETAGQERILSVCAAGNTGTDLDSQKTFPASYASPYTIVVGASTPDDELASFSCYGREIVDVVAPGTAMLSTYHEEGYLPGVATDQFLLTFEDERTGFKGEHISIIDHRSFSGTHSLEWVLQQGADGETYREGAGNDGYTNILTLDVPVVEDNAYFGISYWSEEKERKEVGIPLCYIEAYKDNQWSKVGSFSIEDTNFWRSKWFPVTEGVTQLRLISMDNTQGSKLYLDQIGIGKSTGKYAYLQGTSTAAPMVAAEIAMLSRVFPEETPLQIRGRVIGGVDRTMKGLVVSEGRINMQRAQDNPYPVIHALSQDEAGQILLKGAFFGEGAGKVSLNAGSLDIISWHDQEIMLKYMGNADGYGLFKVTRQDGESSEQVLLIRNRALDWNLHESLPQPVKAAATAVSEDMIYVIGGTYNEEESPRSVYRYNIKTDRWGEVASLPSIEHIENYASGASATVLDGNILLMTFDDSLNKNDFYLYSIKEDKWETLNMKTIPTPKAHATLTTYKDAIYLVGGQAKGDSADEIEISKEIWKLNKDKTQWEQVANLAEGRYAPIVGVASNQMIITGGRSSTYNYVASTEIFNGKKLITGASLPFAGVDSQNSVYGGGANLYVITGDTSLETAGLIYEPDTNTWRTSIYRLGHGRISGVASAVTQSALYAIGGEEDYRTVSTVRSIEIEENVQHKGYGVTFWIGVAVIVIIIVIILITIWSKKKKKPKKMYIR